MEEYRTEYRIIGRFRGSEKRHVVDSNRKWTKQDAENRLKELKEQSKIEMENKSRRATSIASTEYYTEYDLLDLKIQARKVTKWQFEEV